MADVPNSALNEFVDAAAAVVIQAPAFKEALSATLQPILAAALQPLQDAIADVTQQQQALSRQVEALTRQVEALTRQVQVGFEEQGHSIDAA
jgi:Zn-dependent oligopeptidase